MHRLDEVVDTLLVLQKKHRIRFDVWQVVKRDHAIISFFDQGMNPISANLRVVVLRLI